MNSGFCFLLRGIPLAGEGVFLLFSSRWNWSANILFSLALLWVLGFLSGSGECPVFAGEVDISSVTKSLLSGHHSTGEYGGWWASEPVGSQCFLLQSEAVSSSSLPKVSQMPPNPGSLLMGGAGWAGRGCFSVRGFGHLPEYLPELTYCQTAGASPLYLHPSNCDWLQLVSVAQKVSPQLSRPQMLCVVTWLLITTTSSGACC